MGGTDSIAFFSFVVLLLFRLSQGMDLLFTFQVAQCLCVKSARSFFARCVLPAEWEKPMNFSCSWGSFASLEAPQGEE